MSGFVRPVQRLLGRVVAGAMEKLTSEHPAVTVTPLATVRSYDDLHAALRARADALKVTRLGMDEVAGLPMGYCGTLLAPDKVKIVGKHSMGAILGVLGLMLLVIEDPEAMRRFTARLPRRRMNTRDGIRAVEKSCAAGLSGNSDWGKLMQQKWMLQVGPRRRKKMAKTAIKVRWAKHRARHRDVRDRPK